MCIAIFKKPFVTLTDSELKESYVSNPDGCGFAYIKDYTIQIHKTMDFDDFMFEYRAAETAHPESPFLIHFRIKTHGEISTLNCHPFQVNEEVAFIHNGTVRPMPTHPTLSDTNLFNNIILKHLPEGWFENEAIKMMMEEYIGWSKMVFLRVDGEFFILNENKGHWNKDCSVWYSNDSYKPRVNYYSNNKYSSSYKRDEKFDYEKGKVYDYIKGGWVWPEELSDARKKAIGYKPEEDAKDAAKDKEGASNTVPFRSDNYENNGDKKDDTSSAVDTIIDNTQFRCANCYSWNHPVDCVSIDFGLKDHEPDIVCKDCLQEYINCGLIDSIESCTDLVDLLEDSTEIIEDEEEEGVIEVQFEEKPAATSMMELTYCEYCGNVLTGRSFYVSEGFCDHYCQRMFNIHVCH